LKNLDSGRDKSDTQCVLKMKWHAEQTEWHEVDHTEVIHDDLDPNWSHYFSVIYNFGQSLKLRFEINDMDSDGSAELVGVYETTLTDLVKEKGVSEKALTGPH
jgi:Ca2+-dependent lipid-binding protein